MDTVDTVGLVGAGHMGSALGAVLLAGGHPVVTTLQGRSSRTARFVAETGLSALPSLTEVVAAAQVVLVVTPPGEAVAAAGQIAAAATVTGTRPLVADLNATAPSTVEEIAAVLAAAGLDLVDGSISGPPPAVHPGARIYLSGPRAAQIAQLAWHGRVQPVVVDSTVGTASAVKMCTASVYKGLTGLLAQAMRAADHYGVLSHVLADLASADHEPAFAVAMAATKAHRYVPEMRQISAAQAAAGLPDSLFAAFAQVYEGLAATDLARDDPETLDRTISADEVVARLRRRL